MSIQRWRESEVMIADDKHGWWVRYDDHVATLDRIKQFILDHEHDGEYCKVVHSCGLLDFINGGAVHDR